MPLHHASVTAVPVLLTADEPQPAEQPKAASLIAAGEQMVAFLARGQPPSAHDIRAAMEQAFGASDSTGRWIWKDAYEALEVAQTLFLRRYLPAMRKSAKQPSDVLTMLQKLGDLIPTHTRRSDEQTGLQQFSTPLELAFLLSLIHIWRS